MRVLEYSPYAADCPSRQLLDRIGDRWSVLVIGTLVALGRFDELRMHVRAALQEHGLSVEDIKEVLLQQAIYCGVPAANRGFELVQEVVQELMADG